MFAIATTLNIIAEENAFRAMIKEVRKVDAKRADNLITARRELMKEKLAHQRALEIADASRPRNFWGE